MFVDNPVGSTLAARLYFIQTRKLTFESFAPNLYPSVISMDNAKNCPIFCTALELHYIKQFSAQMSVSFWSTLKYSVRFLDWDRQNRKSF